LDDLFFIIFLLSFPTLAFFVTRFIISAVKKNKEHRSKFLKFSGITFAVMIVSVIAFVATAEPVEQADKEEPKKVETTAPVVKEEVEPEVSEEKAEIAKPKEEKVIEKSVIPTKPVVKQGESLRSYIDGTLEPLVRSVSTNIDVNWGFYMIEPFERLEAGGNIEPFHSDIELLDSLYTGIIKQIDESKTPDHFSENEINGINEIKTELKNAINKRIEVIDILIEIPDREKTLNTDTLKIIEKSNEHLQKAANTYMTLGK